MSDYNKPIDPILLKQMRGRLPGQPPTVGAGVLDKAGMLRAFQMMQPRVMGGMGGTSRMPQGALKPMPMDPVTQGEMGPGELETLAAPHLNKPTPGGNLLNSPSHGIEANDPQNMLKSRLERMQRYNTPEAKYMRSLIEQRERIKAQQGPEQPVFNQPATITPMAPNITPRQPLDTKQIYTAARKLDTLGDKENATLARQYNFKTEQLRDKIKDYQLAHTDLKAWAEKNAVPDFDKGMEEMERLNTFLKFAKQPELNFMDYKEMKRYELQEKMRRQGADGFYAELKSNLTSMHNELDRIHKLIEGNSNGE